LTSFWRNFLAALQFLTRVRVPSSSQMPDSLPLALKFFPFVGLLIGAAAAIVHALLAPHLPRFVAALLTVTFLVLFTGCLHEDGLADAADGFGGGWTRDRILLIMHDSRIGTYGATSLILTVVARVALIASLPSESVTVYLIASHVLCRWTTLPLSYFLPPARSNPGEHPTGLGAQIARLTSLTTLIVGTSFTVIVVVALMRIHAIAPIASAIIVTLLSGLYYRRRIQGVTGDCFGATNQLTEIGIYLCGVWT
jgi:adenosylcobinamide-GDP ribazoletransferase